MKFIYILSLLFCTTSCGLKQIVVPNIDMAIEHKMRKEMSLTYSQQKLLGHDIDIVLNKMAAPAKKHILPFLQKINAKTITEGEISLFQQKVTILFTNTMQSYAFLMAKYLSQLNPKQFHHFIENFEKEDLKIQERIKDYDTNLIIKRFEFFFGVLNSEQVKTIEGHKPLFVSRNKKRFEQRIKLKHHLLSIFNMKRNNKISNESLFTDYLGAYEEYNNIMRKEFANKENKKLFLMSYTITKQSSEEQIRRLQSKLEIAKEWVKYFIKHQY